MEFKESERNMTIKLNGRIDSINAATWEKSIEDQLTETDAKSIVFDAEELQYISSAGLRVILRVKKNHPDLTIKNVNAEVYDIFEMTGFTEMMKIEKAYRVVSVEGCEVIGEGYNGKVYRIDRDNVVKVYKNADSLPAIQHEREVARLALILGIPTAISYDVVRVGESFGSVFELLNAQSFSKILAEQPERIDWCVKEYVDLMKKLHETEVPAGKLPSAKQKALNVTAQMKDALPDGLGDKLERMMQEIPESNQMIHGDYHTKNIVLANDEVLLIDMDTLSVGNPIFELAQVYNAYVGFSEYDPEIVWQFQGFDANVADAFWKKSLQAYFQTQDEAELQKIESKVRCVAYAFLIAWNLEEEEKSEEDQKTLELWMQRLCGLLREVDTLII